MTFPTDVIAVSNESSNVTAHGVLMPATVLSTDILGFWFEMDSGFSVTTPSGFTLEKDLDPNGHQLLFFKKTTVTGSEGGTTVTVTSSSAQKSAHMSFASDGIAFHLSAGVSTTLDGTPDSDNVAPGVGTKDFNFYSMVGTDKTTGADQSITTVPTGYTDGVIENATGGGGVGLIRSLKAANAASEDPGDYLLGRALDAHACTMAIEPSDANPTSSGAATLGAVEASGTATVRKAASGAATIPVSTASGSTKVHKVSSGAATVPAVEASGTAQFPIDAEGEPSIPVIAASGTASVTKIASGAATIPAIEASGSASVAKKANGAATIPSTTASGAAKVHKKATGAANIPAVTADGTATVVTSNITASGAGTIPAVTASGTAKVAKQASGAASIASIVASGIAETVIKSSGAASITPITASGLATVSKKASGAANTPAITASGVASIAGAEPHILRFNSFATTTFRFIADPRA